MLFRSPVLDAELPTLTLPAFDDAATPGPADDVLPVPEVLPENLADTPFDAAAEAVAEAPMVIEVPEVLDLEPMPLSADLATQGVDLSLEGHGALDLPLDEPAPEGPWERTDRHDRQAASGDDDPDTVPQALILEGAADHELIVLDLSEGDEPVADVDLDLQIGDVVDALAALPTPDEAAVAEPTGPIEVESWSAPTEPAGVSVEDLGQDDVALDVTLREPSEFAALEGEIGRAHV